MRKIVKKIMMLILCTILVVDTSIIDAYASNINENVLIGDEQIVENDVDDIVDDVVGEEESEEDNSEDENNPELEISCEEENTDNDKKNNSDEEENEAEEEELIEEDLAEEELIEEELSEEALEAALSDLTYTISNNKVTITGCKKSAKGNIYIPSKINGYPVVEIGDGAYMNCVNLTGSVIIPNTVTKIGSAAFWGCTKLKGKLSLPSSLREIKNNTFLSCSGLYGSLVIPDSVVSIGANAFLGCSGFSTLTLPSNLKEIGDYAFADCSGLSGELVIPNNVVVIGQDAFDNCSGFSGTLRIPSSVTNIKKGAFWGCAGFDKVYLTTNIKEIGEYAFYYYTNVGGFTRIRFNSIFYCDYNSYAFKSLLDDGFRKIDGGNVGNSRIYGNLKWNLSGGVLTIDGNGSILDFDYYDADDMPWISQKDNISKIIIGEGISSIGFYQFRNYKKLNILVLPSSMKNISKGSFSGCTSLLRVDYNGTKTDFKNVIIDSDKIKIRNVAINYTKENKIDGYFKYISSINKEETSYKYTFRDDLFNTVSTIYNHELAKLSLKTEMAAFGIVDMNDGKEVQANRSSKYIEEMMVGMGFEYENQSIVYPRWGSMDSIGTAIGRRKINNTTDLVLVAVRGGGYGSEWGGNTKVGNTTNHAGFDVASNAVYSRVKLYLKENGLNNASTKIWMVGYSRGAAVANLTAAKIIDSSEINIIEENMYAYTFETPRNTRSYKSRVCYYNCIYNIINPNDLVTMVAPLKWEYGRYGRDIELPSAVNTSRNAYDNKYDNMINEYSLIINKSYNETKKYVDRNNTFWFDDLIETLDIAVGGRNGYVGSSFESEISNELALTNGHAGIIDVLKIFATRAPNAYYVGDKLEVVIGEGLRVAKAHYPELCLAWLESLDGNIFSQYGKVVVNCPVDIIVKEKESGIIVAKIIDENVEEIEGGLISYKDKNGQKVVYIPGDIEYETEIIPRETGNMTVSVEQYSESEITSVESFLDLSIEKNKNYLIENEGQQINLIDNNNVIVEADYSSLGEDIDYMYVETTSIGAGYSYGGGYSYHIGEFAQVTAVPNAAEDDFIGWYIGEELISTELEYRFPVKQNVCLEARFGNADEKIYVKGLSEEYTYTGKAIIPEFQVYQGMDLLEKNVDYSVIYKNNTNVSDASDSIKAPSITVKGKGDYDISDTVTFKIVPADISGDDFNVDEIIVSANGKEQKPKPVLKWNGKIVPSTLYTYQYYRADDEDRMVGDALTTVKEPGNYVIEIKAKENGNHTGTYISKLILVGTQKIVSKLSIPSIQARIYTGEAIEPNIIVRDGKKLLTRDIDFTVSYFNNVDIGTATVVIKGRGDYVGTKKVSFKINGTPITKAVIEGISSPLTYTGDNITFSDLKLYIKATSKMEQLDLLEGRDYLVNYINNQKAGTATVVINGINGYTGVVKKSFRIMPIKQSDVPDRIKVELSSETVEYSKSGAKPQVTVKFLKEDGTEKKLDEKADYIVTYAKNTAVNDGSNEKNLPTIKITLKGSFSGVIMKNFKISAKNMSSTKVEANDKIYQNKEGAYTTALKVSESGGEKLIINKDYEKIFEYRYCDDTHIVCGGEEVVRKAGDIIQTNDIIPADTNIKVTVFAKAGGNYTGSVSTVYRITKNSIISTKVTIPNQIYTGKEIYVDGSEIEVKSGNEMLKYGKDFIVIPGSYANNIAKGSASVVISGIGNYGAIKKVNFAIKPRGIQWWWKKKFLVSSRDFRVISNDENSGITRVENEFKLTEGEVEKIQFVVWSTQNGFDDVSSEMSSVFTTKPDGIVSAEYSFNIKDHNSEKGEYAIRAIAIGKNGDKVDVGTIKLVVN